MIAKVTKYTMIVVLLVSLSCKKEPNDSDLAFSQTCDFSGSNVETVNRSDGTLSYTNNIMNIPPSQLPPNAEYKFLIRPSGRLQMVVCNMPSGFEMEEGESRSVKFSGRVVVFPEEVDAANTWIELSYLKFE